MAENRLTGEQFDTISETSQPFVGQWNRLVSTTNWEKGKIIQQWRESLAEAGAAPVEFSDEAWARTVGGVTGQHVGRLRRVYLRFGDAYESYEGLYWTHFFAALDWEDAEMWLEGAVQDRWSVSQMRGKRWETLGGDPADDPAANELTAGDTDEDFEPARQQTPEGALAPEKSQVNSDSTFDEANAGPLHEGPDFGDEPTPFDADTADMPAAAKSDQPVVRPFANMPELPDDLADAVEGVKLAILRHKANDWRDCPLEDVMAALDSLKSLAAAPSGEAAPF